MKKTALIAACVLAASLALVLAGCGNSQQDNGSEQQGQEQQQEQQEPSNQNQEAPNPWTDVADGDAAAQGAGLSSGFMVPAELTVGNGEIEWVGPSFSYMEGIAQARFDAAAIEVIIRKGEEISDEELAGDYNDYAESWSAEYGGVTVHCQGFEAGRANLVMWTLDGAVYALECQGLGGENYGLTDADLAVIIPDIR